MAGIASDDHLILKNGDVCPQKQDKKTFLMSLPQLAPYTTMRTVNRTLIVEFDAHVQRMVTSGKLLLQRSSRKPLESVLHHFTDTSSVRKALIESTRSGVLRFEEENGEEEGREYRVTVAITEDKVDTCTDSVAYYTIVECMPPPPKPPIDIILMQRPEGERTGEAVKSIEWIHARRELEEQLQGAHEVVMTDEDGNAMEGTQSNFFAVLDDKILTSKRPEVLVGTIRKIVEKVCEKEGILISEEHLNIKDARSWTGAFLTSSTRLVLPVTSVKIHQTGETIHFDTPPLLKRIGALVVASLEDTATSWESE